MWTEIDCIQRNGEITGYAVQYQEEGGANVPNPVDDTARSFDATGLQPFTVYTFRVAGVNEDVSPSTGPFAILWVTTEEEGMSVHYSLLANVIFHFIHSSWTCV